MKKVLLAGVAVLTIAGSSAVYAQHGPWHRHHHARMSSEDRAAFADARIAAVKAGLHLTADQEKLWPPVETAVRNFAKLRIDRANARMQARDDNHNGAERSKPDPLVRLHERADNMAATGAALKQIADAADPLYKSLDDGQKRRLRVLTRIEGGGFGGGMWRHHRRHQGDFGRKSGDDREFDHDRGGDRDHGRGGIDHDDEDSGSKL